MCINSDSVDFMDSFLKATYLWVLDNGNFENGKLKPVSFHEISKILIIR